MAQQFGDNLQLWLNNFIGAKTLIISCFDTERNSVGNLIITAVKGLEPL